MESHVIIPAPRGDYMELSRTKGYHGHHWRKHILNLGELTHPKTGEKLQLDDDFYSSLARNFEAGVSDIVAVPLANDDNKHVEGPLANAGEVMGITREGDKVFVDLDVRDPAVHSGLKRKTILGASAFLHMNYTDTRTNQKVGPTLLHSCITNRPYVVGLDDYEEVVAATMADSESDVVVLSQEGPDMPRTREEVLAELKADHGIDVEALQAQASTQTDLGQLSAALTAALGQGGVQLTGSADDGTVTLTDVISAVSELAESRVRQETQIQDLRLTNAQGEVDGYIKSGRVLPAQRDAFVSLAMGNREMLDALLPAQPIVALNAQQGQAPPQGEQRQELDIDAEVAKLTADHSQFFSANGTTVKK
jgi:Mu-like prophage I protein